jgi:hypothetical protein
MHVVHHAVEVLCSQIWPVSQSNKVVQSPATVLPSQISLVPLQYWVVTCSWASAPQSVSEQPYSVVESQGTESGSKVWVEALQHRPAMHSTHSDVEPWSRQWKVPQSAQSVPH